MTRSITREDLANIEAISDQALDACEYIEALESEIVPQFGKVSRRSGAIYHLYQAHRAMRDLAEELRFLAELEEATS